MVVVFFRESLQDFQLGPHAQEMRDLCWKGQNLFEDTFSLRLRGSLCGFSDFLPRSKNMHVR